MLLYKLITKDIKTHHDIQTEMPQQEEVHRTKTKLKGETNDVPLTSEYGGSHMARVLNIFFRERLVFRRERSRGCRAHRTSYKTTRCQYDITNSNLKEKVAYWKMAWNSQGTTTGIGSAFLGGGGAAQIRPHELVV